MIWKKGIRATPFGSYTSLSALADVVFHVGFIKMSCIDIYLKYGKRKVYTYTFPRKQKERKLRNNDLSISCVFSFKIKKKP